MDRVTSSDGTKIAVHTRWSQVSPAFEQHFAVFAIDRRGRGASGDAEAYSIEQEGADVAVGVQITPAGTRAKIETLIERGEREEALLTFFREVVRVPENQLETMKLHPAWQGRVAAVHTVAREIGLESEYRLDFDRLRLIRTPTLLLLGGDSPAFFHEATRRVDAALPDNRILELPGQQHIAMDLIPDRFVSAVRSFLITDPTQ